VRRTCASCPPGSRCCGSYTAFCCTLPGGSNFGCPPHTFVGGWWQCNYGSGALCGTTNLRYIPGLLDRSGSGVPWRLPLRRSALRQLQDLLRRVPIRQLQHPDPHVTPIQCRLVTCVIPCRIGLPDVQLQRGVRPAHLHARGGVPLGAHGARRRRDDRGGAVDGDRRGAAPEPCGDPPADPGAGRPSRRRGRAHDRPARYPDDPPRPCRLLGAARPRRTTSGGTTLEGEPVVVSMRSGLDTVPRVPLDGVPDLPDVLGRPATRGSPAAPRRPARRRGREGPVGRGARRSSATWRRRTSTSCTRRRRGMDIRRRGCRPTSASWTAPPARCGARVRR
jgi:hypothetical protein